MNRPVKNKKRSGYKRVSRNKSNNLLDHDFIIEKLKIIVEAVAKTFGSKCEVVLHDLEQLDKSIVKIEHGYITGRKVGGSVTDLGLRNLKENMTGDLLLNYNTITKNGRSLRSSTVLIRDRQNIPIAALCINIDITDLQALSSIINELCQINPRDEGIMETFENDVTGTMASMIDSVITNYHKAVPALQKEDRVRIVAELEKNGAFLIKGGVKLVAKKLSVSKYSIYSYLEDINSAKNEVNKKNCLV